MFPGAYTIQEPSVSTVFINIFESQFISETGRRQDVFFFGLAEGYLLICPGS